MRTKPPTSPAPWSPPTRRSFLAMIGAAAAAMAIRTEAAAAPRPIAPTRPRWIGHS